MAASDLGTARVRRIASHQWRATLRRVVAFFLYYSGLLWLYARRRLRGRAVVLTYHRILPPSADTCSTDGIVVTPATFAMHMAFLKRHLQPLSAQRFRDCMARGQLPDRSCLVTFDDGWYDNERFALPILERWDVPAVIFVATGYVGGSRPFWQEELTRLLFEAARGPSADKKVWNEFGLDVPDDASDAEVRRLARRIVTKMKSANRSDVDALRAGLLAVAGSRNSHIRRYGDDSFMSWDAARRLAEHPLVAVAPHGHSHEPLTRLGRSGARQDLLRSLRELAVHQLPAADMCAYPNGDHDADVVAAAADVGFAIAFTTVPGHVCPADDCRSLGRVNIHESATSTRPEFVCRLLGLF